MTEIKIDLEAFTELISGYTLDIINLQREKEEERAEVQGSLDSLMNLHSREMERALASISELEEANRRLRALDDKWAIGCEKHMAHIKELEKELAASRKRIEELEKQKYDFCSESHPTQDDRCGLRVGHLHKHVSDDGALEWDNANE